MTGFADLVKRAKPALIGGGVCTSVASGRDWLWRFTGLVDDAGTAIDLSSGMTATGVVTEGGSTLVTLTFSGASDGSFTLSAAKADTAIPVTASDGIRRVQWSLHVADAGSGKDVQFWLPGNSELLLRAV